MKAGVLDDGSSSQRDTMVNSPPLNNSTSLGSRLSAPFWDPALYTQYYHCCYPGPFIYLMVPILTSVSKFVTTSALLP